MNRSMGSCIYMLIGMDCKWVLLGELWGVMNCSAVALPGLPLVHSSSAAVVVLRIVACNTICKPNDTYTPPAAGQRSQTNDPYDHSLLCHWKSMHVVTSPKGPGSECLQVPICWQQFVLMMCCRHLHHSITHSRHALVRPTSSHAQQHILI